MFDNFSTNRLDYENKQLKLQLETTLDQARKFQEMAAKWKDEHDKLSKKVTTFCSCITSLEYARRQIGGNGNQVSKMTIDELLSFTIDEYNKQKRETQELATRFSKKIDEKNKIIEDLKAQISIYEIEKAQPPYISNQPVGNDTYFSPAQDFGVPNTPPMPMPSVPVINNTMPNNSAMPNNNAPILPPAMDDDGDMLLSVEMEDIPMPPIPDEVDLNLPPIENVNPNNSSQNKKNQKPVSTFSNKKNSNVGPIVIDEELDEDLTIEKGTQITNFKQDLNVQPVIVVPDITAPNPNNVITEDKRNLLKAKIAQANEQKMHMIDINPLIQDVQNSEIGMMVFRLIGEQGMSQMPLIKEILDNSVIEKGGKSSVNVQINNMIRSKILSRDNVNTGYRRFIVIDFTPIGVRMFEEIFKKSPVESEKHRLTRENASLEHGYLIQDTMTILKKEFGYVKLTIDRKQNTIPLGNNRTYIPDIIATIDGKIWDYIEVERGTHTQKDFSDKLNKMRMVTKTFYFVSQNQEMLNAVIEKTQKWIEEVGPSSLTGLTIKFSTLSHLSKRNWSKIITL